MWYLDEDGKYKTADGCCTGYDPRRSSCTSSPACGTTRRATRNTRSGPPTAPRPRRCATTRAKSCATHRDVPCAARRSTSDADGPTPTPTAKPARSPNRRSGKTSTSSSTTSSSYMYWRYFLWNFVGRQSDIQPSRTTITDGNWLSGIRWIDEIYLGPQDNLPREIAENKGRNTYYFLPFLLGLIGLRLPAEPRPAQLLDRAVAVRDDGHRAGLLLQHLARRAARTRLRLCRLVLRLLDLDRIRRAGPPRPDRAGSRSAATWRRPPRATVVCDERPGDPRGPELGRPRPFAPHDGPRHRLELPAVDASQLDHPQLRRQRHLPAVEQPGGLRRAPRRADHEHLLPRRRVVHRRDEDQGQRRPRRPLLAAQAQVHLQQRHDLRHQQHRPPGGDQAR